MTLPRLELVHQHPTFTENSNIPKELAFSFAMCLVQRIWKEKDEKEFKH
jgi:hypothetical protein